MKKPFSVPGESLPSRGWVDDADFMTEYPCLCAFLADVRWDDGSDRATGSMLLCTDGGMLKAWLNDKALSRSAWVTGSTFQGLLRTIEAGLAGDCLAWRAEKPKQRR